MRAALEGWRPLRPGRRPPDQVQDQVRGRLFEARERLGVTASVSARCRWHRRRALNVQKPGPPARASTQLHAIPTYATTNRPGLIRLSSGQAAILNALLTPLLSGSVVSTATFWASELSSLACAM